MPGVSVRGTEDVFVAWARNNIEDSQVGQQRPLRGGRKTMQIGKGKQGVNVVEYGPHEDPLGYIEPACENPQWILWFDPKGDAVLYTEREYSKEHKGAVIGEPLRLKARVPFETRQQKEIKRLKDEVERLTVQLAGCSTAANGATKDVAKQGDYGWSVAYQDVLDLRNKFDNLALLKQSLPKIVSSR
jgi:hypothetical protein